YNAVARLAGADVGRFVAAANFLRSLGLSAPEIIAADYQRGLAIIEDLGDALYCDIADESNETELYAAAAEVLAALHLHDASSLLLADKRLHPYRGATLFTEIDLLTEWFMPLAVGRNASAEETVEHRALW